MQESRCGDALRRRPRGLAVVVVVAAIAAAAPAGGASLVLDQAPLVLGRFESVGVTLHVEEPEGDEVRPLRLSVNVGSFGEVTRVEPGVYRTVYTPPETRFPQVALVAAWREAGPDAPIEFLRIPLYGSTRIDAVAPAGSEVRVQVGTEEFGPVRTSRRRRASVPVDVPPDVPEAIIKIRERSGASITRRAAVSVPPYNRLTVALVPHAITANGEDWVRVVVLYDRPTPVPAERIQVRATEGSVQLLSAEGGQYAYRYRPRPGTSAREVGFSVSVEGDPAAQGSATVSLRLPLAAEVVVSPPDEPLFADGHASAPVRVRVYDEKRLGLPMQNVELMANGRRVPGLEHRGGGVYEARFVAPAEYPENGLVRFSATVYRPDGQGVSGTANYQVLAPPIPASMSARVQPRPLLADGSSRAVLALDVRDEAGAPLRGARLLALAGHGTAGPVVELGEGRYRVDYIAPDAVPPGDEALVRVVDTSNRFESVVAIPLRAERRFLLGVRGGWSDSLGGLAGARGGLDAWAPFRIAGASLALGATATVARAVEQVRGPHGVSESAATFAPVSLRLAYAPWLSSRIETWFGAGPVAVFARVENDRNGYDAIETGFGVVGFAGLGVTLGPGQLFAEAGWSWAPVEHPDFFLDGGGVSVDLGYRFGLF